MNKIINYIVLKFHLRSLGKLDKIYYKQVSLVFVIKLLSIVISLLYIPLVLGYLEKEKYGIWITLTTIVNWIGVLDIGMANGLRNKLSEALAKNDILSGKVYISTAYLVLGIIFLSVLFIFFIINPLINWQILLNTRMLTSKELYTITSVVVSFVILRFIVQTIVVVEAAKGDTSKGSMLLLISNAITLLLIWIVTAYTEKGNLLILSCIVAMTPFFVYTIYTYITFSGRLALLSPSIKFVNFEYSKGLIGLSFQFFIVQITSTIIFASIPFVVAQLFNPQAVTNFNIVTTIFNLPIMLFSLICAPIVPLVTHAYANNDINWLNVTLKRLIIGSFIFSIGAILIIFFSEFIYNIWLGNIVDIPRDLTISIGCYTIINILLAPYSNFINGLGKIKILTVLAPVGILMFICLSIVLSKWLKNVIGVSIALSCTSIIGLIVLPIQIRTFLIKMKEV